MQLLTEATAGTGEPDIIVHACSIPNDPDFLKQWGLWQLYSYSDPSLVGYGTDAVDAWNIRTDASSVVVAVIDSGIRYTHEDLASNIWKNSEPTDDDIHG